MSLTEADLARLSPHKLTDLADSGVVDSYIDAMRAQGELLAIPRWLRHYAYSYCRDVSLEEEKLEALAIFVADQTYRYSVRLTAIDAYTRMYFTDVVGYVWDILRHRGIGMFYILDNEMRDDRFMLAAELFMRAGVAVVTPYDGHANFESVAEDLRVRMAAGRHVAYIEKDASVNYIPQVAEMARGSGYLSVLRNRAPGDVHLTRLA